MPTDDESFVSPFSEEMEPEEMEVKLEVKPEDVQGFATPSAPPGGSIHTPGPGTTGPYCQRQPSKSYSR
jgi:hypothetical protein